MLQTPEGVKMQMMQPNNVATYGRYNAKFHAIVWLNTSRKEET